MSQGRSFSFDCLRMVAIIGIVLCHYFFNWEETMGLGRFLACTFNALFLGMSGLLLGLKWKGHGGGRLPNNFLIHRLVKLAKTYYPFLLLMFVFYGFVTDYPLTTKNVVMHIAFLPWFDKLHGFEHLWFMTMIVICYVGVYVISRISCAVGKHEPHFTCRGGGKFIFVLCVTTLILPLHHLMLSYGLPGQMFLYLWFFILCFYHAVDVVTWMKKVNWMCVILASFIIGCSIFIFHAGLYASNRLLAEWLGVLDAIAVAMIVLRTCRENYTNKIVSFISGISFEIYLEGWGAGYICSKNLWI